MTIEDAMNPNRADLIDRIIAAQKAVGGVCKFKNNVPYLVRSFRGKTAEIEWHTHATTYTLAIKTEHTTERWTCETIAILKHYMDYLTEPAKKEANGIGR